MPQTYRPKVANVEAMQFNGMDDYLTIVGWMKQSSDTFALADEVRYETPLMLIPTVSGLVALSPGDWVVKDAQGVIQPYEAETFEALYELVQ